ncbi:MAG: lamin tail domain-containing protein [Candidatus Liptonbacteria bacterium]|nr:lamin tail domain-containing protein [Candidatus Liptonbacteria bacterium]
MVYINEWLSNPSGKDSGAEWVEIFNNGSEKISLQNWTLVSGNGKKFILSGKNIDAGGYLVLKQPETKLTLRNQNESLSLYDNQEKIISQSSFSGTAPEGKTFSRTGDTPGQGPAFIFAEPTPGAQNKIVKEFLATQAYPLNQPLNKSFGSLDAMGLALFVGLLYPFLIIAIFKRNDYLSKLFFGRD